MRSTARSLKTLAVAALFTLVGASPLFAQSPVRRRVIAQDRLEDVRDRRENRRIGGRTYSTDARIFVTGWKIVGTRVITVDCATDSKTSAIAAKMSATGSKTAGIAGKTFAIGARTGRIDGTQGLCADTVTRVREW